MCVGGEYVGGKSMCVNVCGCGIAIVVEVLLQIMVVFMVGCC